MTVIPRAAPLAAAVWSRAIAALLLAVTGPLAQGKPPVARPAPAPATTAAPAPGALPAANFWIDLREVDEPVQNEPSSGAGGTVLGTARSSLGGGVGTARAEAGKEGPLDTQLRLANGAQGRLVWQRAQAQDRVAAVWAGEGAGANGSPASPGAAAGTAGLRLQREWLTSGRQLVLAARWPGGDAPVAVDLTVEQQGVDEPGATGAVATRTASTTTQVLVRLDQWVTVSRSAAPDSASAQAGVTSTRRDAAPAMLLQLRLRLAAPLAAPPKPLPSPR